MVRGSLGEPLCTKNKISTDHPPKYRTIQIAFVGQGGARVSGGEVSAGKLYISSGKVQIRQLR